MGDSAGGNMAAALISMLIKSKNSLKIPNKLILINPTLDVSYLKDFKKHGDKFDSQRLFFKFYLNSPKELSNPLVSPLLLEEELQRFPETFILLAENDPTNKDSLKFFEKLQKNRNKPKIYTQKDAEHLAGNLAKVSPLALPTVEEIVNYIKKNGGPKGAQLSNNNDPNHFK